MRVLIRNFISAAAMTPILLMLFLFIPVVGQIMTITFLIISFYYCKVVINPKSSVALLLGCGVALYLLLKIGDLPVGVTNVTLCLILAFGLPIAILVTVWMSYQIWLIKNTDLNLIN